MFARRRSPAVEQLNDESAPEAPPQAPVSGHGAGITGPAAKLLSMLGISPEQMAQTAAEVKALVEDFRVRLERIEAKVDHLNQIVDHGWQGNAPDPSRARTREDNEQRNGTR